MSRLLLLAGAMRAAVLMDSVGLTLGQALTAQFAVADLVKAAAAGDLCAALLAPRPALAAPLLGLCSVILVAAAMTTHAAARLSHNPMLPAATGLHILGAAIWVGGIPSFVMALDRLHDGVAFRLVGPPFPRMSTAEVACIVVSAATMTWFYIGSWSAAYGTAYGVMAGATAAMFATFLLLGLANFRVVERLRADPGMSVLRMRRFADWLTGRPDGPLWPPVTAQRCPVPIRSRVRQPASTARQRTRCPA